MIRPPAAPRDPRLLIAGLSDPARLLEIVRHGHTALPDGTYLAWDDVQRRRPPDGFTREEWWLGIKMARRGLMRPLALEDRAGRSVQYAMPDPVTERLQRIDRDASGQILLSDEGPGRAHRDRYVVSSLIEESIMSSLLEGAATTRAEAKEMIRTNRKPTTKGERMVLNNFLAMREAKARAGEPLTPELILDLHRTLSRDAAEAGEPGRFRGPDASGRFGVWSGGRRLYVPPPHEAVPAMVEQACAFVNDRSGAFVHPVVRAIALHYWIGYVHPFEDGNGRTARALFYWSLLREGYWLFEFVAISGVLARTYQKYARAYLLTETDESDLTYFLLFHLDVIDHALDDVQEYIRRKTREMKQTRAVLHPSSGLNHRQIALLRHALTHPEAVYTFRSHQTSHGVVYQTARTDLLDLVAKGLLDATTAGRKHLFRVPPDIDRRIREGS